MMARTLKPKPEYSCEQPDPGKHEYIVKKLTPGDLEEESAYTVHHGDGYYTCDCYAGLSHKYCRHLQIVDIFKAEPEKIGSVATYNFDRKCWT